MKFKVTVHGFSTYSIPQMEKMKTDLGLSMPLPLLQRCAAYYARMKRDPYAEELRMLDLFSKEASRTSSASLLTRLSSEDEAVASTYADFLKKRKELSPSGTTPPTLFDIPKTASAYLNRIGRRPSSPIAPILLSEVPDVCAAMENDSSPLAFEHGAPFFCAQSPSKRIPTGNDRFLLLTSDTSPAAFHAALGKLFSNKEISNRILANVTVGKHGLLYEVLCLTDSAWLDLSRLSRVKEPVPFSLAVSGYEGARILRIASEDTNEVLSAAHALSISACVFGVVTADRRIRLSNGVSKDIFLDTAFLVSLLGKMPMSAVLPRENPLSAKTISHRIHMGRYCPYLQSNTQSADVAALDGYVLAGAYASPYASPFLEGLYTALIPICKLAACGCDLAEQALQISVTLPETPAENADYAVSTAMLLGLYRVMAECAIPARHLSRTCGSAPALSVFADAQGEECSNRFVAEGSRVSLWIPKIAANGLPDFHALRQDLARITALRRSGALRSAHLLCNESLTDALAFMSGEERSCKIKNTEPISEPPYQLAMLLETDGCIPTIPVGTVVSAPSKECSDCISLSSIPSPSRSAVWAERPSVALYADAADAGAKTLTSILLQKNADATLFTNADADAFSRALLTSHFLILCGKVALPDTPQIRFALETLRRAGGRILSVGNPEGKADFLFKSGFTDEILNKICTFSE